MNIVGEVWLEVDSPGAMSVALSGKTKDLYRGAEFNYLILQYTKM